MYTNILAILSKRDGTERSKGAPRVQRHRFNVYFFLYDKICLNKEEQVQKEIILLCIEKKEKEKRRKKKKHILNKFCK